MFAVECQFKSNGDPAELAPNVAAHLYKIAQEALNNAIKHGKARRISLILAQEQEQIRLSVWNDGLSFQPEVSQNGRMGLRIMNYRAHVVGGSLEFKSDDKEGTLVSCLLPLCADSSPNDPSCSTVAVMSGDCGMETGISPHIS